MKGKLDSFLPRHISSNLHHPKKNHNSKRVIIERVLTDDISTRVLSLIRLSGLVEKDLIHPEDVREIERREWNIERFFKGVLEEVYSDYKELSSVSEPDNSSEKQSEQLPCNTCIYRYLQSVENGLRKRKDIGEGKVSLPSPTFVDKQVEEAKEKLSETIVRNLLWRKKINYRSLSFSSFPEEFFQTGLYEFGFVDSPRLDDGERGATTTINESNDDCSCSGEINPHHPSSGLVEGRKTDWNTKAQDRTKGMQEKTHDKKEAEEEQQPNPNLGTDDESLLKVNKGIHTTTVDHYGLLESSEVKITRRKRHIEVEGQSIIFYYRGSRYRKVPSPMEEHQFRLADYISATLDQELISTRKLVIILNMEGLRWENADLNFGRHLIFNILNFLPVGNKAFRVYIYEFPWMLKPLLQILLSLIPSKYSERIVFVSKSDVGKVVPLHYLPVELGGRCETGMESPLGCPTLEEYGVREGIDPRLIDKVLSIHSETLQRKEKSAQRNTQVDSNMITTEGIAGKTVTIST